MTENLLQIFNQLNLNQFLFIMNNKETLYLGFLEDPDEDNDLTLQNFPSFSGGVPLWL